MKSTTYSALAAFAALATPAAFANHVDFLTDGGFSATGSPGDGTVTAAQTGNPGNILGAEREVSLTSDLGTWTAELNAPTGPGATAGPGGNILLVSASGPDADSALGSLSLLYDGAGSAGLGGADFASMWNFISVEMPTISGGALDLRLTVSDTDNDFGQVALGGLTSGGNYAFAFDDAAFTNAGVDFDSVNSVQVDIEGIEPGVSYSVGGITREVVPEPGSALLVGLGACGFFLRRRRA